MTQGKAATVFPVPAHQRYFEDYVVGAIYEFGEMAVSEADIVEFARRYDPQPFHVDAEAAAASPFGGLIASGWHTAALMMRLLVDNYVSSVAGLASPGVDELRWVRPVRPGDRLRLRVEVLEARRSVSKPDRGILRSALTVLNQADETVMTVRSLGMLRCRTPARQQDAP